MPHLLTPHVCSIFIIIKHLSLFRCIGSEAHFFSYTTRAASMCLTFHYACPNCFLHVHHQFFTSVLISAYSIQSYYNQSLVFNWAETHHPAAQVESAPTHTCFHTGFFLRKTTFLLGFATSILRFFWSVV